MASRAMNIKFEESRISDIKDVAEVFHMTMTDVINEALDIYLTKMKKDPFYKLTSNVKYASAEESKELLRDIENLSDDDLVIGKIEKVQM